MFSTLKATAARVLAILRIPRLDRDLEQELDSHSRCSPKRTSGAACPRQARRAARIRVGARIAEGAPS